MARATRYGPQPIKKVLAEQGRSLKTVARLCGLHHGHLFGAAGGWHSPDIETRETLSSFLNLSIDMLFTAESLTGPINNRRPRKVVQGE
jgi:hypothetical protein